MTATCLKKLRMDFTVGVQDSFRSNGVGNEHTVAGFLATACRF